MYLSKTDKWKTKALFTLKMVKILRGMCITFLKRIIFIFKVLHMPIIKQAFYIVAFIILLCLSCSNQQDDVVTEEPSTTELKLKDINPKVLVGSPVEISFNDTNYTNIIKTELSTGEGLWYARFGGWLGEKDFDYTELNKNINWIKTNGMSPTVHMLVGPDNYMPDWLINEKREPAELDSLLRSMIYNIMETNDNKNKVDIWNVINELFDDDGTYRTNMLWSQIGWEDDASSLTGKDKINEKHPVFIRKAFTYCREKTSKKLELRDFNIETDNSAHFNYRKNIAAYQLIKHMLNSNIPIDALGIQGHLTVDSTSWALDDSALKNTVKKFKALGIEVYITELDVTISNKKWSTTVAQKQKEEYYNYVKQAVEGGASRISFWGVKDDMDPYWLLDKYPLPWDKSSNRKASYYGVQQALMETK